MKDYEQLIHQYKNGDPSLVVHAKIGAMVWNCGNAFESISLVKVTERNYAEVNAFWDVLYYDDKEAARKKNWEAHAEYGAWQQEIAEEYWREKLKRENRSY